MATPRYRHILVPDSATPADYTYPRKVRGRSVTPDRDRGRHAAKLAAELERIKERLEALRDRRTEILGLSTERGTYVELASSPGFELALQSLDRKGVELVAVRKIEGVMFATVLVSPGKLALFERLVRAYLHETTEKGKPKNKPLIDSIDAMRAAVLESFWTDSPDLLPSDAREQVWWEIWLRTGGDASAVLDDFRAHADQLGLTLREPAVHFPERTVLLGWASRSQIEESVELLDCIAELRRPKDPPTFFMSLDPRERQEWVDELRLLTTPAPVDAPAVCLLDTGVNAGHPLIQDSLAEDDLHTCDPEWGVADHHGHGTEMAGIALYGDLTPSLSLRLPVVLSHRLESVTLLPGRDKAGNEPEFYAALTAEAVGRAELGAPERRRTICMAITAPDARDRGRPSSWSAEIDKLAAGADDGVKRLFVLSAGNVDEADWIHYPNYNDVAQVEDPAQAWNALTVGAHTERHTLDPVQRPGWTTIARPGTLSPVSTTSLSWASTWPNKPDFVLEGGNGAREPSGRMGGVLDELALLTTSRQPRERVLETTWGTSPAAADAARLAAILSARYSDLWPETVRALLVHSANWTSAMVEEAEAVNRPGERCNNYLLRRYGYGVPNLERASWSAGNVLTLVVQEAIQPFHRDPLKQNRVTTRDYHEHSLPWPEAELQRLGAVEVELRITLSYFIEPAPSGRAGFHHRFRYQSHGLRFAVAKPDESIDEFRARVTRDAQEEEFEIPNPGEPGWGIGRRLRDRGSIHSDRCRMLAADIARRRFVAVYPVGGWWKERAHLRRVDAVSRYALIVSITTPETDVDIYVPVAVQLKLPIVTEVG